MKAADLAQRQAPYVPDLGVVPIREACKHLGVSRATVRKYHKLGVLKIMWSFGRAYVVITSIHDYKRRALNGEFRPAPRKRRPTGEFTSEVTQQKPLEQAAS